MTPQVLFVLSSDPRASHRPAEALRIAAGAGVWQTADIKIYLHGPAVALLGETPDLVDGDEIERHLAMLAEAGQAIYVEAKSLNGGKPFDAKCRLEEVSPTRLAELAAQSNYLLHF
jgi:hypothetical protein